jgi:hypothetical protein
VWYSGSVDLHGQPHGFGELSFVNDGNSEGDIYTGQFLHGYFSGIGKYASKREKWEYTGEWANGDLNGVGLHCTQSGDRIAGEFRDDYLHGFAKKTRTDGVVWLGRYAKGVDQGRALRVDPVTGIKEIFRCCGSGQLLARPSCMCTLALVKLVSDGRVAQSHILALEKTINGMFIVHDWLLVLVARSFHIYSLQLQ